MSGRPPSSGEESAPRPAPSTAFAVSLLTAFLDAGVTDLVVAPGSRSQALALVAAGLERSGRAGLRVRLDERDAGFLALGLAKESGRPAVVITTSGTAVANLHPAVLEAHHSGVPMVVLTADRPEELRGIGSNQTTTQVGMFGEAVRGTLDAPAPIGEAGEDQVARSLAAEAVALALGRRGPDGGRVLPEGRPGPGPVHLNVAFTEPLSSPFTLPVDLSSARGRFQPQSEGLPAERRPLAAGAGAEAAGTGTDADGARIVRRLAPGLRTAVIAGTGGGERAEEVARQLGAVLFAEIPSGAHFGPQLVVPYRAVIRDEAFLDGLERLVVFGHPTLSREIPWLIERSASAGVEVVIVRTPGVEGYNPGHAVTGFVDAIEVVDAVGTAAGAVNGAALRSWTGPLVAASRAFLEQNDDVPMDVHAAPGDKARNELAAVRAGISRRALVDAVWRASWPHDRLVVAASRLIRELDRFAPGKRIPVHANRGLAGIDGTISTAVGVALAQQHGPADDRAGTGVTRLLIGDLAFLHDVGGLAFGEGEARPRILVVVGNDRGGTIFDELEVGADLGAAANYERVMLTPQTASIEGLARAYGWEYRRVEHRGDLDPAISTCTGPTVVEVPLAR